MRDRTRRFTVGFGDEQRHVQIMAGDAGTLHWCARNEQVMGIIVRAESERLQAVKFAKSPAAHLAIQPEDVETTATIAARFKSLLLRAFPDESFEVVPLS